MYTDFFFSSRRRHTRCALVTGVQTCALPIFSGMITTAENLARDYGITRAEADAYAARSHQRAAAAWRDGKFGDEVVAVPVPQRRGDPIMFDHDEGYRADATIETLAALKPLEGGVVTAEIGRAHV